MKKNIAAFFLAVVFFLSIGCFGSRSGIAFASQDGTAADGEYTIGIEQFAIHPSLDNCREGFLAGLAEEGFIEGENLTVMYENAQADTGIAAQISNNFAAKGADLICGIATVSAQSAYSVGRKNDIPVIYTAVTDPAAAGLAGADGSPVGEVTGTSDKLPVEQQLDMIRKVLPDAKTIGILYTTSEANSLSAIEEYKKLAPEYGFEIVEGGVSASADIPLAADSLLSKVDCLTNLTDNTVVSSLPLILDKASKQNKPVFGSEIEQVRSGCLAAMGLDYVELGKQTGRMAAKVLKGEAKASEIPYEVIEEAAFYGNLDTAAALGITIPDELISSAAEVFSSGMDEQQSLAENDKAQSVNPILQLILGILEEGLVYAVMALGVYITYKILDFPDLSVDGTFPMGSAFTATMILSGFSPLLTLPLSFLMGAAAGCATGLIHVKLKVRDLLAGIIVMTGLYSINLRIAGGKANVPIFDQETIFDNSFLSSFVPSSLAPFTITAILLIVTLICKVLLDLYLKTRSGYLLRAVGDNETLVTSLAMDKGKVKIIGLAIANGFAALAGCLYCQQKSGFEISMGTGTMVIGLANVIIGTQLLRHLSFVKATTAVIVGSILYKACISFAISFGLEAFDLKLITAALLLIILVISNSRTRRIKNHA